MSIRNRIGFLLGLPLFLFLLILPMPASMSPEAQRTLAVAVLMAFWWITEAIPIPATALIPIFAFPLLKITSTKTVTAAYGDSNIYLFLGGFLIAITMQRWNLHKRIALHIVKFIGTSPNRLILGFMVATAFLSMWISNTATTMMMYPIGLAIVLHITSIEGESIDDRSVSHFRTSLMLSIAYAASVGGIGTLIGTPPNIVFAATLKTLYPEAPEIGFLQWMLVGIPLVFLFIPIIWLLLTKMIMPVHISMKSNDNQAIQKQIDAIGPMSKAEWQTLIVFLLAALGWIFRKTIVIGTLKIPGWSDLLGVSSYANDATVAILAGFALFVIPVNWKEKTFLLDWETAKTIPWGILILFGGGIALAAGFKSSGLAAWIGHQLRLFGHIHHVLIVMITCTVIIFLTEVTSNTATATIFMPILASMATVIGMHPFMLMIPATIAASCAFMLPVATPPNAIVFASGHVTVPQMARAGFGLNILGILVITLIIYLIAIPVFGIAINYLPTWIN